MSLLAKTNLLSPSSVNTEIKLPLHPKVISFFPANSQKKPAELKNISSTQQDIPINKWIMPAQPQGYLSAKTHDIL